MNIVTTWDPFKNVNPLLNRYVRDTQAVRSKTKREQWSPLVDIFESKANFELRAELPGVDKQTVKVSVDENVLTIKGEKTLKGHKEDEQWKRVETTYGLFNRRFTLPEKVDVDNITAAYENGVLNLSIPKLEPAKPKVIDVKVH